MKNRLRKYLSNAAGITGIFFLLMGILLFLAACRNEQSRVKTGKLTTLHEFAGAPARLVWVQDLGDNTDVSAQSNHLRLMGYDSEDDQGERVILPGPENFYRPLIAPSGNRILFSEYKKNQVQIVDWSGRNRRDLTTGRALAVWRDPADGIDWVYVGRSPEGYQKPGSTRLYRVQLDNPAIEEPVWEAMPFGDAVHLSGDGRYFSAEIANADCALIDTERGQARRYGKGCWPGVSPDRAFRFWFFDGSHRNLEMVDTRQGTRNRIHIAAAPGIAGNEVYHPRWSNNSRFMVMTGPYKIRQGGNNIRGGGAGVEVYAGRFNTAYTEIEAWFRVTNNQRADFYPDMWVAETGPANQQKADLPEAVTPANSPVRGLHWPVANGKLLFAWDNAAAKNEWTGAGGQLYQAKVVARAKARFALNYQMDIRTGWYKADRLPEPAPVEYTDAGSVSVEFVATLPLQENQADGVLLSMGNDPANQTILRYEQGSLVLVEHRAGQDARITRLGQLPVGPSHVILLLEPGRILLTINGEGTTTYQRKISPFTIWPLIFGSSGNTKDPGWNGLLEHVALYGGILNDQELEQLLQGYRQMRKTAVAIEPVIVRAELVSASTIPSPEDILPYRRGLVVDEYRITKLLQGDLKDRDILVARWAILDGKSLPAAERQEGKIYELRLDAFDNRPELEGERLSMESDNLLLPMYYQFDF
ncbi:MAG TPA: hypothetical protein ENI88_08470 [Desulfobulbus sp.]|nr:hypothetical protein [Desulfobulbus sp.]